MNNFKNNLKNIRNPNIFEKILLFLGIFFVMFGYGLMHKIIISTGVLNWGFIQGLFLWFIIIILMILVAVVENVKEELKIIIKEHAEEINLLAGIGGNKQAKKKEVKK